LKDKSNGVYIFVLEGELFANEQKLERRDGVGIWEIDEIAFKTKSATQVLLMEVPMIN
jgi:redox-sensitive bicupin YhaK (pirin superfamily)